MPETIMAAPVALPMQLRRAPILPATVNAEARSVDVVFTTGAAVRRRRCGLRVRAACGTAGAPRVTMTGCEHCHRPERCPRPRPRNDAGCGG